MPPSLGGIRLPNRVDIHGRRDGKDEIRAERVSRPEQISNIHRFGDALHPDPIKSAHGAQPCIADTAKASLRPAFVPGVETAVCDDIKSDHSTSSPAPANPVLVEATRGRIAESVHRGRAAVVDVSGRVAAAWGDIEAPVYPRSAVKPLQALALVESGAADAFGLDDTELALACASHSAEPRHLDGITAWLERMGLTPGDLECGAQWPLRHEPTMEALIRAGERSTALHNNCSGKHTGMLATALHLGAPCTGYVNLEHPVQQRIMGILEQMCGYDLSGAPVARDGCSVPSFAIPLGNLARGMACFASPDSLPDHRTAAVRRVGGHTRPGHCQGRGRGRCLRRAARPGPRHRHQMRRRQRARRAHDHDRRAAGAWRIARLTAGNAGRLHRSAHYDMEWRGGRCDPRNSRIHKTGR
jgi:L-asparaginase II